MTPRALITGSTGFIGKRLRECLITSGFAVYDLTCDIRDLEAVRLKVKEANPHFVFHLATYGNEPQQTDPASIYGVNVLGTANLLEAIGKDTPLIFASTSSVYGYSIIRMKEDNALAPNSHYAIAKVCAEQMIQRHCKTAAILRLFSVYGPGEPEYRLLPTVRSRVRHKEALETADPEAVRDFVHVDDVVDAFYHFRETKGIFNIGTGRQWTVRDVAELAGIELKNTGANVRPWESPCWMADIYRASDFGWEAKISFIKGLRDYIEKGNA